MRIEVEKVESFSSKEINPAHKWKMNKVVSRYYQDQDELFGTENRKTETISCIFFMSYKNGVVVAEKRQ